MFANARSFLAAERVHFSKTKVLQLREFWGVYGEAGCGERPVHKNGGKHQNCKNGLACRQHDAREENGRKKLSYLRFVQ
jgi:hypothetical protein